MPERQTLTLHPSPGSRLRHLLLAKGMEFPCGGDGTCGQCRVRVIGGEVPATPSMRECLSEAEIRAGWRLGCLAEAHGAVTLEVAQWHATAEAGAGANILTDTAVVPVEPREGLGVVVDLGTTTLVAQCVDLASGEVIATETALNTQARWGADLMSRIRHDLDHPGELGHAIREQLGAMIARAAAGQPLQEVLLVGNTAMHHLFCGHPVDALAAAPFRTPHLEACSFTAAELHWPCPVSGGVTFLPNLGGFVGSDILAGIAATGLGADTGVPEALLDLGTNGEIAIAAGGRILCASTAAGPAFEAANIRHGMRAASGAIHRAEFEGGHFVCDVLGGGPAQGLCGSGLVDAVACALDAGMVLPQGRLRPGLPHLALCDNVIVTQKDIRELQLAKAAIASGLLLLTEQCGAVPGRLYLAGAFGNYLRQRSARRIGLLPPESDGGSEICQAQPAGNTALRGVRQLLLSPTRRATLIDDLRRRTQHVELAASPRFKDAFVEALTFPTSQ